MRVGRPVCLVLCVLACATLARADVPPGTPYVESATHPIRVYYEAPAPKAQADALLSRLDEAWTAEIEEMGFAQPLRVLEGNIVAGFHITIRATGPEVAYTFEVLGDDPATPEADCPILGIASTAFLAIGTYYQDTAWHVLNHASLHAVDCLEMSVPTNDIFTIGVQLTRGTVPSDYLNHENTTFQRLPEWSLDAVADTYDDVYYSFGSSLYALFLEERFGARDGKLLAEIWRHTAQNGHVTDVNPVNTELVTADVANSPHWFDAIAAVLATKGSSFDAAYQDFAVWRLLAGPLSDGKHFQDAAAYPAPAFTARHDPTALPVVKAHPTKLVARYGTSYVTVDSPKLAAGQALRLSFSGGGTFKWAAQAVCALAGKKSEVSPLSLNAASTGAVLVGDASRCKAVVLAVENLSEGAYVPDQGNWGLDGDYVYSIITVAMPTLTSVSPALLHPGDDGVQLTVKGSQYATGAQLGAAFSGTGIEVSAVELVDDLTLRLTVRVAADAAGPRDLTVTNGNGLAATLANAVTVEAPPDAGAPGLDASVTEDGTDASLADAGSGEPPKSSKTGCSSVGGGAASALFAMLTLLGAARRRR
jgi:hypothetical protein